MDPECSAQIQTAFFKVLRLLLSLDTLVKEGKMFSPVPFPASLPAPKLLIITIKRNSKSVRPEKALEVSGQFHKHPIFPGCGKDTDAASPSLPY